MRNGTGLLQRLPPKKNELEPKMNGEDIFFNSFFYPMEESGMCRPCMKRIEPFFFSNSCYYIHRSNKK